MESIHAHFPIETKKKAQIQKSPFSPQKNVCKDSG